MNAQLLLLLLSIGDSFTRDVELCYADDYEPYLNMGVKTAYTFIGGGGSQIGSIPNCNPVQFWMIAKHEARYPAEEKIITLSHLSQLRNLIIANHEVEHSGHMCDEDLHFLKTWWPDPNMKLSNARELVPRAINDMRLFAKRLQSDFPELLQSFNRELSLDNFMFRNSGSKASQTAMESFAEGLFDSKYELRNSSSSLGEDTLMKAYSNCSRLSDYEEFLAQDAFHKRDEFFNSSEYLSVISNVSRRTGFKYPLKLETILMIYDMCRFEKAWVPNRLSPWCAVFSTEDLKVIEYAEDIIYYYGAGYGRRNNPQLGCLALLDMMKWFRDIEIVKGTDVKPKGIFYFTDTLTMLGFLTSMGIYKDEKVLGPNNYIEMGKRQWRTSLLAPFNSNLVAVFYRCRDNELPNKVMFYLQERPLMIEGCQVGLCDWEYLKNKFQGVLDQCHARDCHTRSVSAANYQSTVILFIPLLLISIRLTWRI